MSKKFSFFFEDEERKQSIKNLSKNLKAEFEERVKNSPTSKKRNLQFCKTGIIKYQLILEGEMQVNSMNVKTTVENKYLFHIKEIFDNAILLDLVSYDKEMTQTTQPTFKEMFTVTRQLEKLYDEFTALVSLEGKIKDIRNLKTLQEKWLRIKNEMVPYFNEGTNIEEFFGLNDQTIQSQDFWKQLLNEQEFFFLFFRLPGYRDKLNFSKKIEKDNAYRSGKILWNIQGQTENRYSEEQDIIQKVSGTFIPGNAWLQKAYGKMPFLTGITFKESFKLKGEYHFDPQTGCIKKAQIYMEEVAHPAVLYHTMKFTLTQIN